MFRTHQHFVVWAVASTFTKLDLPILSYSIIKLFRCGSEARCHRGVPSQSPPTWTSDPIDISCLASYQTQESQERPTMSTLTASSIYKDTVRNPPMVNTHQATNSKNKLQAIARGHTFLVWSVACLPLCACAFFFARLRTLTAQPPARSVRMVRCAREGRMGHLWMTGRIPKVPKSQCTQHAKEESYVTCVQMSIVWQSGTQYFLYKWK